MALEQAVMGTSNKLPLHSLTLLKTKQKKVGRRGSNCGLEFLSIYHWDIIKTCSMAKEKEK